MNKKGKRLLSLMLALLMAVTGIIPAASAFAADGVEGYYDIELFYSDTDTIVPSYVDETAEEKEEFVQTMVEGEKLQLTYKLIDTEMPDNGYIKWYSDMPTLVDVDQDGLVKAFDSSKGAVVQNWIDNEVKTIPLVGSIMATALEKILFNDKVDLDSMDTEEIVDIVEQAFGSDSVLSKWVDSYKGELVDSLRQYLDNINSVIHVALYSSDGKVLDDDSLRINIVKNDEWYANFLPNGTHITNKSQIDTTVAVGSTVTLSAITTPLRLHYKTMYSVKSSSIFDQGKVVATVNDSGVVTFKNTGTVTIMASPDTEEIIENILEMVNYIYKLENTGTLDTDKIAGILIDYLGIDMNRAVLAAILDVCFAVKDVVGDTADPVQLTASAVEIISNLVLQFVYNDTITFTVIDAQPLESFEIEGANTVTEGSQIQLSITNISPSAGDTSDIVWESSDPTIASVDPKTGTITGRDAGGSFGSLSSRQCTITATSTTNNVVRTMTLTVKGKTGKYLSDVEILGDDYLEIGQEQDLSYTVYPKRVAESDSLYLTWGVVTGTDEEGNTTYAWADSENPATDGIGQIDSNGHYTIVTGGNCTVALKAQTGYYVTSQRFYEISSYIDTFEINNGIPVEEIKLSVTDAVSGFAAGASLKSNDVITVDGREYTYASVKASTRYESVGASINAAVSPANASNQTLTWVVDNSYYSNSLSDDTHTATITQKANHENADTFNVYAVSADGKVKSNVITVAVSKNSVTDNQIVDADSNQIDSIELTRGKTADAYHKISFSSSSDGTYSACYKCNWYSSDEDVFTVETKRNDNRDATITGVDVGTATLYCVSADGGIVDTAEVTVYPDKSYLQNIVDLCDSTVVIRTNENRKLYNSYSGKLDLAYYVLYDSPMASQATCDTYAKELLYAFYKIGGFVGILGVDILATGKTELASDYVTVKVGSTSSYTKYKYDFDFKLTPENAMYSSITWTSSNDKISVDKNGICRPVENEACAAMITCTVEDYMGTATSKSVFVAFSRTAATGITLDQTNIVGGKIGETQTLKATVAPNKTIGGASCTDVYWTSSDESIATVDQNGVVAFKEGGDCVITATTYDGGYTAECAVNVVTNYTALENMVKSYNDQQLNSVNYYPDSWETYQAALTKATNMINNASSSQSEVDAMCVELEAAFNSLEKYNYIQKVELYLDGEQTKEFYQYDLSLLSEGLSYKNAVLDLNVRLYPNNGSYKTVTWESSTTDISVTSEGKCTLTENKASYGMITCTVEDHFGNKFTDSVWVSFAYQPVTAVKVEPTSVAGAIGTTTQLTKTIEPTGTGLLHIGAANIQDVYWESDDESIATVDENGLVTFVSAGATTVRCVSYDGGIYGECRVSSEGDRTALKKAIDDYKDVDYRDYAYDYGQTFKAAYEAASEALTDDTLTQDKIDEAAETLVAAYEEMILHPYVHVTDIDVSYTTYGKKLLVGSFSQKESGTVGSSNAVSVDLSNTNYYDKDNNYTYISLTASPNPSDAMYKSVSWSVLDSSNVDAELSDSSVKLTPTKNKTGAWARVKAIYTDEYNRVCERTISVVLSDNIATGFDIVDSETSCYATDSAIQLEYTISGSPEFAAVEWSSSDESVVTVDSTGAITPVEKGTATITATTLDGGFTDKITVNVLTDFAELASKQTEYYNLIENVKDSYTYTKDSLEVLSAAVAEAKTMIDEGKATQAEANAMLETLNAAYNSLVLYVAAESVEVGFAEEDAVSSPNPGFIRYTVSSLSFSGKSFHLEPVVYPEGAVYASVEWSSSNSDITVNDSGVVTNNSASAGVTLITCTVTNETGEKCTGTAYVSFVRNGATGISFADETVFGAPTQTAQLSPTITTESTSSFVTGTVDDCIYESSDESVATVDENGVVTFVSQGSATITATAKDGGFTATITAYTTWDTTALKAAIDKAEKLTPTDYAVDYANKFTAALETAKTVYANMTASQDEIDEACAALTEATNSLEGHEFIKPEIALENDGKSVVSGAVLQVQDDTQQTTVSLALNDGAMIKSAEITASDENGVTAEVNGNDVTLTKTADSGSVTLTVKVVDEWEREYTETYLFTVINTVIPVTALTLTVDGKEISDGKHTVSCGGRYSKFTSFTVGYIPTPADANAITSVSFSSSNSGYIEVSADGVVSLTNGGKLYPLSSQTATITVTVTNADGSTASAKLDVTITRA